MSRLGPDERAAQREAAQDADERAGALRRARRAARRLRPVATARARGLWLQHIALDQPPLCVGVADRHGLAVGEPTRWS